MEHYKSWNALNQKLHETLCNELKNRITYFFTRYHSVHNAYGRAAVRLDGKECVSFSWIEMHHQENDIAALYKTGMRKYSEMEAHMKPA